jgi:CheY-like chemotaxis protein
MSGTASNLRILIVDDSPDDAYFVTRALERVGLGRSVNLVNGGAEAIHYLCGRGQYADRQKFPFPSVILSDVKMPQMSGFDLLRWVRQDPKCAMVPIILYSGWASESDVAEAYRLGANYYFVKLSKPEDLETVMEVALKFWSQCERPSPESP